MANVGVQALIHEEFMLIESILTTITYEVKGQASNPQVRVPTTDTGIWVYVRSRYQGILILCTLYLGMFC